MVRPVKHANATIGATQIQPIFAGFSGVGSQQNHYKLEKICMTCSIQFVGCLPIPSNQTKDIANARFSLYQLYLYIQASLFNTTFGKETTSAEVLYVSHLI